jgi:hypothetical protein
MEYRMFDFGTEAIKSCLQQFKAAGFTKQVYSSFEEVNSATSKLLEILVGQFTEKIKLIKNYKDVYAFINRYDPTEQHDEGEIAFKQLCKYIFTLIPLLKLDSTSPSVFDGGNADIRKLVAFGAAIDELAQMYGFHMVAQKEVTSMLIHENGWSFHYNDDKYQKINQQFYLATTDGALHGFCDTTFVIEAFTNIVKKTFYSAFNALSKRIFDDPQPINLENVSFQEFSRLINGRTPSKSIIDITDIVEGYKSNAFISGLLFTEENSDLLQSVLKPNNPLYRTRFRPFIQIRIDGEVRYITTQALYYEASCAVASCLFAHNELPREWSDFVKIKEVSKKIKDQHGIELEKCVANILDNNNILYLKNIKSLANTSVEKAKASTSDGKKTNKCVGEIDFIIVDDTAKIVYVADAKFIKPTYFIQSFGVDAEKFRGEKGYERKLEYKTVWIKNHLSLLAKELKRSDMSSYTVQGFFVTDNLVYYTMFSQYPIIPIRDIIKFLSTKNRFCFIPE